MLIGTVQFATASFYYRGIIYEVTGDGTVGVVRNYYSGYSGEVTIPDVVQTRIQNYGEDYELTYVVTSVEYGAFYNSSQLTSVELPNTVKTIGENAFYGCSSLTNVSLSNGLESIEKSAFGNCTALKSITLPNSVRSLGWNAFYNCTSLTSAYLPEHLKELNGTFSGCTSLSSIKIPSSAVSLEGTFKGCTSLKSVVIPNSVSYIGENTFQGCSGLTSVYIPNSVSEIGDYAFSNTGLTNLMLPSTVTSIRENAFQGCGQLAAITTRPVDPPLMANRNAFTEWIYDNAKLTVPQEALNTYKSKDWWNLFKTVTGDQSLNNSYDFTVNGFYYNKLDDSNVEVTYKDTNYNNYSGNVSIPATVSYGGKTYNVIRIGYRAFYHCTGLTSISMPSSVTLIAASAFNGCTGLTSLTIPQNIVSIGSGAFDGCTGLTQLVWNAKNCLSNGDMSTGNISQVNIGNNVEAIPMGFVSNSRISSLNIPSSVTHIGAHAFEGCGSLSSLTIPIAISCIGDSAFAECSGLESLTWNAKNCRSNGNMATANITKVIIGSEVEALPLNFAYQSKITNVTIPASVKQIDANSFYYCTKLSEISLPSTLESIGTQAFCGCSSIKNLSIPRSVTSIGEYAFSGCDGIINLSWNAIRCGSNGNMSTENITQVTIGNEVKRLPYHFVGGSRIPSVAIPNSVDSILPEAFYGCSALKNVTIPNSVIFMGDRAFSYCENMTSMNLSNSLNEISNEAFSGCSSLTEVIIPESVQYIGYSAFADCSSLDRLSIGKGVNYISDGAFYGCCSLSSIVVDNENSTYDARENCNAIISSRSNSLMLGCKSTVIPNSVTSISSNAFSGCTGLTSINIPSSITSIGYGAFYECTGLTKVETPSIESWCKITFDDQNSNPLFYAHHLYVNGQEVTSLEIPSSVTTIKSYAFSGCAGLTSLAIGTSVTEIGYNAFYECTGIRIVYFNAKNCTAYGEMFPSTLEEIVIGDNVEKIPDYFVSGCTGLTSITIPNSVTSIGSSAFSGCTGLSSITLPSSITSIASSTFRDCTGLKSITIPNAVTSIGSSAFYNCTGLTNVSIGSSVTSIGNYAFYNCSSLVSVTCWAVTPPSINYYTFYGTPEAMTVFVLPDVVETYRSNYNWSPFDIEPIQGGTILTVNMPADADMSLYIDMKLAVSSASSGKTLSYVLTDKRYYSFVVNDNTTWNVSLANQYGDEFGKIENVEVGEEDVTVEFSTLKKPQTVSLAVKLPNGEDVTAKTKVSWKDEKGKLLVQGNKIAGLPAGRKLNYSITLPQELATAYSLPADMTYTVKDGGNTVVCQLTAIAQTQLSGKVKESTTNQPLYGASVSATQTFAGGNTKTFTATTDNQGVYTLDALSAPTTLTVAAQGYITQTVDCDDLMTSGSNVTLPDVSLNPITGAVVNVNLTYTPAHSEGESAETQNWYIDYNNVDYEVYNKTTGRAITNISVQYPQIVLMEDVNDGDELELTASSRKEAFNPVKTTVTIAEQKASATFNIVELGKIAASFNENTNAAVVGMLYDNDRKLVKRADYSGDSLTIDDLTDGNYRLVTMGKSELFNTIYDMQEFPSTGLKSGVDYINSSVVVNEGIITKVNIDKVPFLDESKLYYTGEQTSFTVNKPSIVVGNYLTFRAQVDFKEEYIEKISDVQLIIDLPESCPVYENSVLVGTTSGIYTLSGNRITIPISNYDEIVRFCAIPTVAGDFAPSAFVKFKLRGKSGYVTQPIGAARYTADALSINVPVKVATTDITVTGTAIGVCEIDIFDNDVLIGHTTSLANGAWSSECELNNPYNLSLHNIYAKVKTAQGIELRTETASCLYDKNFIMVNNVSMLYDNPEMGPYNIVFDFINGTVSPSSYYFFPYKSWPNWWGSGTEPKEFTFVAEFTNNNPEIISNVVINVFTDHGTVRHMAAIYDTAKDRWVATGYFESNNLPINVSVSYYANTVRMPDAELINNNLSISVITQMQDDMEREINEGTSLLDQLLELYVADDYDEARITELENEVYEYFGITEITPVSISNQEEGQQLIDELQQELSDPNFLIADNFINTNIHDLINSTEYNEGIDFKTCDEYDETSMVDNGFEKVILTDSTCVYYKQTETEFIIVSFPNNIAVSISLETLSSIKMKSLSTDDFIQKASVFIEEASANLNKVTDGLCKIKDFIDTFSNVVGFVYGKSKEIFSKALGTLKWMAADRRAGMAFPGQRIIEGGLKDQARTSGKVMLGTQRMGNSISKAMNSPIGKAAQKVLAAFDIISQIAQGIEDVKNAVSIYRAVPDPCENDQVEANNIKGRTAYIGLGAIAFYGLNIAADVIAIKAAIAAAAGLAPSAGVSASVLIIDLGLIIAKAKACDEYHKVFEGSALELQGRIRNLKCKEDDDDDYIDVPTPPCPPSTPIHDPSGFVYEGVPSNRLQGVTATCYYKETVEDMYGDTHEEVVLWDAEQYGQENPLLTDENGYYRWDVPIGMWQVKYEKVGYETTYSDWLPVPPPQLDVNIGMVQMRQPEVIKAHAYPKAVELEFDKFMIPETLTTDNITVSVNGTAVSGNIELLNAEKDDPLAITSIRRAPGTGLTFASRVRFNADQPFNADQVTLHVKQDVKSYADLQMNEDYEVTLPIEYEMEKIVADSTLIVPYSDSRTLTVTVMPAMSSKGKTLNVRTTSSMIISTDAETYTLDSNGQAVVTVFGDLPGMGSLLFGVDGYDLSAATLVNVKMESELTVATPTASIASGSEVEKGTAVYLSCSTEGATIYYTLDGSCPCDNTPARKVYDGTPIIINTTTTIKAMATAPDLFDSDVATFIYRVSSGLRGDVNGDGEVNIADVNALIDIILGGAVDEDTRSRADVNGDSEVNIADINALIDIILSPSNRMRMKVNSSDLLHMDDVAMLPGDVRTINVTLDDANSYSAMQCDVVLPAGLTLIDISSVDGHISKTDVLDESTMRAVSYSMDKRSFLGDEFPVMSLTVRANAALGTESEIKLTNVVLADATNKAWRVEDCTAQVSNATGINDLTACVDRVWVEGETLCIETRQDGAARIATINGVTYDLDVKAGVNRYVLDAGLYVVVINGRGHKIAVR
jgi:hypothetical protein